VKNSIRYFKREGNGRWRCLEPTTLDTPIGTIQVTRGAVFMRGTRFMNFDVAAALDEQYDLYERPSPQPDRGD
jgi:hypothetical protein